MPDADVELATRRACCPACHRRGRGVTVGFVVEGHGLFPLTRRPKQDERDIGDLGALFWQMAVGASYISSDGETFSPPLWRGGSNRVPERLARAQDPIVVCRHGHRLTVPPVADLDRMLKRIDDDVIYLPAVP